MKPIWIFFLVFATAVSPTFSENLSLNQCLQLAMLNNPDLKQSDYGVRQAEIGVKSSLSNLLPKVSASASANNSGPFVNEYGEWNWGMSGGVSQPIYQPGLFSSIKLSKVQKEIANLSYKDAESRIRSAVETAYYQILTSDTLIGVYRENIRLAGEQIRKMRLMVELGLKRESDLLKSEVQKGTFESQLIQEQQNQYALKRELNLLMGREPDAPLVLETLDISMSQVPDFETARSMLYSQNPNLKSAEKQLASDKLSLQIAREDYLPSASASYSYTRSKSAFASSFIESDQIGVQLSLNLFDGFSRCQNVQKGKIQLASTQLEMEVQRREMEQSLSNQYTALETQEALLGTYTKNLEAARKDLEIVSEQYAAGMASILDLMDAQVSVIESQTSLVKVRYARIMIESGIRRLIGQYDVIDF
jgi:outer membrane protein